MDLADACWYWFLVALIDASHCLLLLWGRFNVCSIVVLKSAFKALSNPLFPRLYCSWILALTSRSFMQFGCCQCNSSFLWSHCCLALFSTHCRTSDIHFTLEHLSCLLSSYCCCCMCRLAARKPWLKLSHDAKDCSHPASVSIWGGGWFELHAWKPSLRSSIMFGSVSKSLSNTLSFWRFLAPIA